MNMIKKVFKKIGRNILESKMLTPSCMIPVIDWNED